MKLGLALPWANPKVRVPVERVQRAERLGFDSVWTAEIYGQDAITPLAFLAAHTRRIRLGTAVIQAAARTPAATALAMATVDQLAGGGRVIIGIGLSGPQIVEGWYGQPWGDPRVRLRDYVTIMRKVLRREGPVAHDGKEIALPADKVLVTVGRKPLTEGWGLENMGLEMHGRFVKVDEQCRTAMSGVYAVGDLVGEPMLAHKSAAQGEMVAELIAGKKRVFDPVTVAAVCFTEPEIVSAGMSPHEAGEDTITAMFPFMANGRALSMDAGDNGGFVRIIARKSDHKVLGIQAVGAHVSELSNEFSLAISMGAVLEDIAGTIHVHPTLGEAFHESALRALGHAIHI